VNRTNRRTDEQLTGGLERFVSDRRTETGGRAGLNEQTERTDERTGEQCFEQTNSGFGERTGERGGTGSTGSTDQRADPTDGLGEPAGRRC
jgi:hypothetical protein